MISDPERKAECFGRLARPNGVLALLANDQRESLRTLLTKAGVSDDDHAVTAFKVDVARVLSPLASGMLIDPLYGLDEVRAPGVMAPSCGLIVAADRLHQQPGEAVTSTDFDASLDFERFVTDGAAALKLLVLWRRDEDPSVRDAMVRAFVKRCAELGVLSVVEGIVRTPDIGSPDHEADVVAAAADFGRARPDLYKAEVPTLAKGSPDEITRISVQISTALPCPWVVLSAGVSAEAFPEAVAAACRGGASGFLAGRGIWGPSIASGDVPGALRTDAYRRFESLVHIVDRHARPWHAAGG